MVLILLCIKAELENVESMALSPHSQYCLTVKNSAGEDVRENVFVSADEEHQLTGSRGTANFALKWERDSKKEAYLNIQTVKNVTRDYTADDSGSFVPIIGFDCRGLEPIDWAPQDGWRIKSSGKAVFDDVDLGEKEWGDYDDRANLTVGVYGLEWKFEVRK